MTVTAPGNARTDAVFDAPTVADVFGITAARRAGDVALRTLGDATTLTWADYSWRVRRTAAGLAALGLGRGDSMACMLTNRPEFHVVDAAAMHLGAVSFSVYNLASPEQLGYVLSHAEARVVVTEQQFVDTLRASGAPVEHMIVVDDGGLDELDAIGDASFDLDAARRAVSPDDLVTLIYTSGTTGPPKGVELTHANVMATLRAMRACVPEPGPSVLSYLPAAHVVDRIVHHYGQMAFGSTITDCPDLAALPAHLADARPTMFVGVPRVWEKLEGGLQAAMAARPELAEGFEGGDPGVLAALRAKVGLDRLANPLTGSAPTPLGVLEFFRKLGLTLREVWGMSETGASGLINPAGAERFGTVGKPMAGLEARLADDGELLVRGEALMRGYRRMPEKTAEAITADGWLKTGDIATVDEDGYYRIVDRKKELIISSAGKNMSPANIEGALKSSSPLIGQAACIGDGRPYNVALLVLDGEAAPAWASRHGLEWMDLVQLADHPYVRKAVGDAVAAANGRLSRVEQIKRWTLLPTEWLPGGDELTPTMKLRRGSIAEKYAAEIEALYAA